MKVITTPEFEESFRRLFSDEPKYVLLRGWYWITGGVWRELKWKWQRSQRGFSDADVWDTNSYLAKIIPPMVRQLDEGCSYPGGTGKANTPEKWKAILEEIAVGFEAFEGDIGKIGDEKKFKNGMKLFVKWFPNLWD